MIVVQERGIGMGTVKEKENIDFNEDLLLPIDEYLEENEGLIWMVVHRSPYWDKEELYQEAAIQFVKCYRNFSSEFGTAFSTYVVRSMEGTIKRFVRDKRDTIRYPRKTHEIWYTAYKNKWTNKNIEEIMKESGHPETVVREAMSIATSHHVIRLDKPVDTTGDTKETLLTTISSNRDSYREIEEDSLRRMLTDQEWTIINGLADGYTQSQIGKKIGRTQVQVSRALIALREKLEEYEDSRVVE